MAEAAYSAGELALSGPFSQVESLAVAWGTRSTCIYAEISRRLGVGFVTLVVRLTGSGRPFDT
jgi:hypothetical protein